MPVQQYTPARVSLGTRLSHRCHALVQIRHQVILLSVAELFEYIWDIGCTRGVQDEEDGVSCEILEMSIDTSTNHELSCGPMLSQCQAL